MDEKQFERLSRTIRKGRTRCILLYGVLGWGLGTAVLWSIAMAAILGWAQFKIFLALAFIGFPIGGFFVGCFMWKILKRNFEKASREKSNP